MCDFEPQTFMNLYTKVIDETLQMNEYNIITDILPQYNTHAFIYRHTYTLNNLYI
jgi:hypothetical protein